MLFKEAVPQYLHNLALEDGLNIPIKTRQLKQHITPYFGDFDLSALRKLDIEAFKRHLREKDFSPATVNRYLSTLSNFLNKSVEYGWLDRIPCKAPKYREDNIRSRYLLPAEIEALRKASANDTCPIIEPFIRIALGSAMRRMEILSIELANIHLAHQEIFIPKAKTGARTQPITKTLARYLAKYIPSQCKPEQRFLFPANSSTGHRMEIEKPFYRVVTKAGLDRYEVTRHTLRHTAITHLVQAGVDLPTVQRFSGHRSIQMVFRYSHQSKDHLHNALGKLDKRI
ncbi:MAG: site-specific integrase [Vampirovibrionales bacterium]|nr:site-specific integrase [Vampirovibrionales bacterium]